MENTPLIKVITFDLDDTLWHVEPVLLFAEQQVYRWLQSKAPRLTTLFTPQQLTDMRKKNHQQLPDLKHQISQLRIRSMEQALELAGYKQPQVKQLALQAFEVFITARHQVSVFDTVTPLLEQLQQKYRLGVLTNGNANIYNLALGKYFDFAFSAEQLNASKPASDHFIAAQQASNASAAQIIHIGDHIEHDILAAQQSGCYSIWFNPQGQAHSSAIQPSEQVRCLSEVPAAIANIETRLRAQQL
ncbi:MAG: HAD-IA family hydrolase [Spongiibacteraceae bacterium]